jgi:RNA polymerase sigma factor (sigma-70 family)
MNDQDFLAEQFEAKRAHLRRVAYRMLGSALEADDAVQEAWIRLSRADAEHVDNLGGWLTTVVARVCLDMLRARKARREDAMDAAIDVADQTNAEQDQALADSVGAALLVVLETLAPAERVAFVLHDMFDVPFEEIGPIVHRTPTAARQLASRARRRVQGGGPVDEAARERKQQVVSAFLTASRTGDLAGLLAVLDPNVVLHADSDAVTMSATARGAFPISAEILGRDAVADTFNGRAAAARLAIVDDDIAAVYAPGGKPAVVFGFTTENGRIIEIDLIAAPARIGAMEIGPLG